MRVFSVRMKVEFPELLLARTQTLTMTRLRCYTNYLPQHRLLHLWRTHSCVLRSHSCERFWETEPYSSVSGSRWMLCSPAVFFSQYLRSHASQPLPAAVSRPVNANAWISE